MPSEPVTLPIHCVYCHGKVTLQMSDWPDRAQLDIEIRHIPAMWECPYCRRMNSGGFPGRLAWVHKGHDLEPVA